MYTISPKDLLIMQFEDDFRQEQKQKGIESPFEIEQEIRYGRLTESTTKFNGIPVKSFKIRKYTEEENNIIDNLTELKNQWNSAKEQYMINKLVNSQKFELDEIVSFYPAAKDYYYPCNVGSCQCTFNCKHYFNCPYKEG